MGFVPGISHACIHQGFDPGWPFFLHKTFHFHLIWMSWLHNHKLLAMLISYRWDTLWSQMWREGDTNDGVIIGTLQQSVRQIWKEQAMVSRWNRTNQCQLYNNGDLAAESKTEAKSCLQKFTKLTEKCFKQPQCHPGSPSKTEDDRNQRPEVESWDPFQTSFKKMKIQQNTSFWPNSSSWVCFVLRFILPSALLPK